MLAFVDYLRDAKSTSAPVTKLFNLCLPFCALASTALKEATDSGEKSDGTRPCKRQKSTTTARNANEHMGEETCGETSSPPRNQIASDNNSNEQEALIVSQQNNFAIGSNTSAGVGAGGGEGGVAEVTEQEHQDSIRQNLEDSFFTQFMDFQPRLQWLDTDFSAFEETWGQNGFGGGLDGVGGYPEYQ